MKHRSRGSSQRGGQRRYNNRSRDNNDRQQRGSNENNRNNRPQAPSALPSPEIFQEYEYASEGTVARLLEMAETEQDRRNAWETEYMRFHKKSLRLGQLFGFILLLSVIWGTIFLSNSGQEKAAIALAASGFGSVAAAGFFSIIGKRLSRRPRRR